MAVEIRDFTVTIPAGTAVSAGFTASLAMPARVVTEIHIRVPPGPRGEVGFAIGSGGIPIVPYGAGSWIVTDNEDLIYPLDGAITSGAWQLQGYNTGSFDHTLRVYFYCSLLPSAGAASGSTLLPPGDLGSGSGGDAGTGDGGLGSIGTGGGGGSGGTGGGSGGGPPGITPPLILPPSFPAPPGLGGAVVTPVPDVVLIGVADAGTVGVLVGGGYYPLSVQDDVNALSEAGVPGVEADAGLDAALRAAMAAAVAAAGAGNGAGSE
jgi:hypothetical protein